MQIGGQELVDLLLGHLVEAAHPADPGVVDEHVQTIEVTQRGGDERLRLGPTPNVEAPHAYIRRTVLSTLLCHGIEPVEAAGAQREQCPFLCERERRPLPAPT